MYAPPIETELPALQAMSLVDVDATMFVSAGIFLVFYLAMKVLLFDPYLEIVRKRRALTGGARDDADALAAEAAAVAAEYEQRLSDAREAAAAARDELRSSGRADEARIVGAAREQASSHLETRRAALARDVEAAEKQVDERAKALSVAIVERMAS